MNAPAGAVKPEPWLACGACHFFKHDDQARTSDVTKLLLSVAGQLAARVEGLLPLMREVDASALLAAAAARSRSGSPHAHRPALPAGSARLRGKRYLVVLDALDECENTAREQLLTLLQTEWMQSTPEWLGLVITTRPESYIPYKLSQFNPTELRTEDEANRADMLAYLQERLRGLGVRGGPRCRRQAARRALRRAVPVRALPRGPAAGRSNVALAELQDSEAFPAGLDGFYKVYFRRFRDDALGGDDKTYRLLLGAMCAARAPLSVTIVKDLLGLSHAAGAAKWS